MLSTVRATVAEELAFGLENRGTPRQDMLRAGGTRRGRTGLSALLDRDPATLSGGELRRLAMGCAVIQDPAYSSWTSRWPPWTPRSSTGPGPITGSPATGTAVVLLSQAADGLARAAGHWINLDGGTATAAARPGNSSGPRNWPGPGQCCPPSPTPCPAAGTGPAPRSGRAGRAELDGWVSATNPGPAGPLGSRCCGTWDSRCGRGRSWRSPARTGPANPPCCATSTDCCGHTPGRCASGQSIAGCRAATSQPRSGCCSSIPATSSSNGRCCGRPASASGGCPASSGAGRGPRWRPSGCPGPRTHPAELSASHRLLALATVLARKPAVLAWTSPR